MNLCAQCCWGDSNFHAGVAPASLSCDSTIKIVLDHDDFLASIWVRLQDSLDCGVGGLALASSDVPPIERSKVSKPGHEYCRLYHLRIANHELEIVVAVNACRDVLVVVLELLDGDNVVALVRLPERHEVAEDFIGSLAPGLEVRVE